MELNVFISWSGPRGRRLAEALHQFIPDVLQNARPWISSDDIDKGRRWGREIADALRDAKIGVICLTPESLDSRWVLFEAGALAKTLDDSYVCPYLLGLEPKDVAPPLADFQVTRANEEDTFLLMRSLNSALGNHVEDARLRRTFERVWPTLNERIEQLLKEAVPSGKVAPARSEMDMLEELLTRIRHLERREPEPQPPKKSLEHATRLHALRRRREAIEVELAELEMKRAAVRAGPGLLKPEEAAKVAEYDALLQRFLVERADLVRALHEL